MLPEGGEAEREHEGVQSPGQLALFSLGPWHMWSLLHGSQVQVAEKAQVNPGRQAQSAGHELQSSPGSVHTPFPQQLQSAGQWQSIGQDVQLSPLAGSQPPVPQDEDGGAAVPPRQYQPNPPGSVMQFPDGSLQHVTSQAVPVGQQ